MTIVTAPGSDGAEDLATWLGAKVLPSRLSRGVQRPSGLRLAFYARTSTREYQDPASSCGWQRQVAVDLIDGHGRIVVEFVDVGCSRRRPWRNRSGRLSCWLRRGIRGGISTLSTLPENRPLALWRHLPEFEER